MYTVYILQSDRTKRYYIGYTSNLERRLEFHNQGMTRSTKHGAPWSVVHREQFETKSEALLREQAIKSYRGNSRFKKLVSTEPEVP